MKSKLLLLLFSLLFFCKVNGQNNLTSFGIQYKPIMPSSYFNSSHYQEEINFFNFNLKPKYSYSLGMLLRQKINQTFSFESGINYIHRNYSLSIENIQIQNDETSFGLRSYEIPIQLLTYVQIKELWYLNVAFGLSYNILTSDILSYGNISNDFIQNTYRKKGGYIALLANLGMEFRPSKSGYYYFGTSLHRPWTELGRIYPQYKDNNTTFNDVDFKDKYYLKLLGSFVTLDFRYFFGE
jgi:hypothetical protein